MNRIGGEIRVQQKGVGAVRLGRRHVYLGNTNSEGH